MPHTMQCPKCQQAVGVADSSAGKRVRCPKCSNEFVVPGMAPAENDDDDWLSLDEPAGPPPPVAVETTDPFAAAPKTAASNEPTPIEAAAPDLLTEADVVPASNNTADNNTTDPFAVDSNDFSGDLFCSGDTPAQASADDDFFGSDLPPVDMPPPSAPNPPVSPWAKPPGSQAGNQPSETLPGNSTPAPANDQPAVAQPAEYAKEFRVRCPICSSIMYAKAEQSGKTIKCSDCHSDIKVPKPPKIKQKAKIDIDKAETFTFTETKERNVGEDPFRKSATKLLEEAEQEEYEEPEEDYEVPKIGDWLKNMFGIFAQPSVLVYALALGFFGSTFAAIVVAIGHPIVIMSASVGAMFFAAAVIACGFTVLESVANNEKEVTDWPLTLQPTEWLSSFVVAICAALVPIVPAWFLGSIAFGANLGTVALAMIAVYVMYPFVLLSMLDMQSVWAPFSPEVAKSVTRCQESWGGFYFSSGILFFATFLFYVACSLVPPIVAVVMVTFATVAMAFSYFSIMGKLAYAIGQAVNEPDYVNTIDRSQRSSNE